MRDSVFLNESEGLARELFARHQEISGLLEPQIDDVQLYEVARNLGQVLLHLSDDRRLKTLVSGRSTGDLQAGLAQVLETDWDDLLGRIGYQALSPAEGGTHDVRESIRQYADGPRWDTYRRLRNYLKILGQRLVGGP